MRIQTIIILVTIFLVVNTYYDNKYSDMFKLNKKYIKMATYGFVGISLFAFVKKNPSGAGGMLSHANNIIKYMPLDKNTTDIISPFLDFTKTHNNMSSLYNNTQEYMTPQTKRMMNSGMNTTKRSVSETKKKYVASKQNWKCKKCDEQLKATFEIDHKIDLRYGGTNHIDNLEALCAECHKEKTMMSNL
tara:strand:- start:252 stop:818 length:567 start_codon:yes stop_codon:yes gene_type:complete